MTLTVTHVCDLCDLPLGPKKNKKGVGRDPEMDDWLSAPESAQDKSMSRCPGVLSALGAQMLRALLRNARFQGQIPATPTGPTQPRFLVLGRSSCRCKVPRTWEERRCGVTKRRKGAELGSPHPSSACGVLRSATSEAEAKRSRQARRDSCLASRSCACLCPQPATQVVAKGKPRARLRIHGKLLTVHVLLLHLQRLHMSS